MLVFMSKNDNLTYKRCIQRHGLKAITVFLVFMLYKHYRFTLKSINRLQEIIFYWFFLFYDYCLNIGDDVTVNLTKSKFVFFTLNLHVFVYSKYDCRIGIVYSKMLLLRNKLQRLCNDKFEKTIISLEFIWTEMNADMLKRNVIHSSIEKLEHQSHINFSLGHSFIKIIRLQLFSLFCSSKLSENWNFRMSDKRNEKVIYLILNTVPCWSQCTSFSHVVVGYTR